MRTFTPTTVSIAAALAAIMVSSIDADAQLTDTPQTVINATATDQGGKPTRTIAPEKVKHSSHAQKTTDAIIFIPDPGVGAPAKETRVGGGTRSAGGFVVALHLLAPNHATVTISDQPTLYWYISESVNHPIVLSLVDKDRIEPLDERRLIPPIEPGIHAYRLSETAVRLEPNKRYYWEVMIEVDRDNPVRNPFAGNKIRRALPTKDLQTRLARSGPRDRAAVLARNGIWYDAVEALSSHIERSPHDRTLRANRASLLEQGDLAEVAAYDKKLDTSMREP